MPNISTINGIAEDNIATHNGTTAANNATINGDTWVHNPYTVATGGSITTSGDYKIHTFNSSGTFEITNLGDDAEVEYLVIAGGGSGAGERGGGGGAGGYRTATGLGVTETS